jgi:DNA-binding IclR family transcriptional regulator
VSDEARKLREWRVMIFTDGPDNVEAIAIAIAIAEHVDWKTLSTVVGMETIVEWTKLCESTVRRRVQLLIRDGYLSARQTGHGRRWKLRELALSWPVRHTGHGDPRPVPGTGHDEISRPVPDASMTGTGRSHDRYPVHPISSETTLETSSEGSAAEPAPADARSAAPLNSDDSERIRDLYRKGYKPSQIVMFRNCAHLTLAQVQALTNDLDSRAGPGGLRRVLAQKAAK